jgi:phage/plasmid-associated DNA primase
MTYELSLSYYKDQLGGVDTWLVKRNIPYKIHLEGKIQQMVERTSKGILDTDDLRITENSVDILTLGNAEAKYLRDLLNILDLKFVTDYDKWFKVICAIHHTNPNYKQLAVEFSTRRPESYSAAELDRIWADAANRNTTRPITMSSIVYWARKSAPQSFEEIEKQNYIRELSNYAYKYEGKIEHFQVASILKIMLNGKFLTDTMGLNQNHIWYEFIIPGERMRKGEIYKWRKEIDPDNIHLFIGEHVPKVFDQMHTRIKKQKHDARSEAELKYFSRVERNFHTYMCKLGNSVFQAGIVKMAQSIFRERGFAEGLDKDADIIGVGNGVLKIGPEPQLIKGYHSYRVSKYTETDYIPFDPENPYIKTLLDAFRDIYPEPDVFEFQMYLAATGLDSKESANILIINVGGGRNGKSFYAKMVHETLGQLYCVAGKSNLLTSPMESSNQANSAQMALQEMRFVYFDEFNNLEVLNMARVKSIVNPGYQSGRGNYKDQVNFKNICNPIALSNFDFIINTTDHGTWRRIYYYKNKVTFTETPKPGCIYEKKVDHRFTDQYPNDPLYKQAMLSIMVHYYSKLCRDYRGDIKLVPVPTIRSETEKFRNRQDTLNKFLTQMVVISPGADAISLPHLASKYIEWYTHNYTTMKLTIIDILSQLENSCISNNIERRSTDVQVLPGYRLKAYVDEPLGDGESYIHASSLPIIENPIAEETPNEDSNISTFDNIADLVDPHVEDILADLTKNAPDTIQNSNKKQNDTPAEDIELDDFLKNL